MDHVIDGKQNGLWSVMEDRQDLKFYCVVLKLEFILVLNKYFQMRRDKFSLAFRAHKQNLVVIFIGVIYDLV